MIKVGIIGCGKITQVRHIPEYLDNPDVQLVALYDLNQQRTEELAKKYQCKAYDSVEALLADPEIDAVSVCTANLVHAQITIAALKAGKHVLCEKPMATTLEDCEAMVEAADAAGKVLMIGQNQRLAKAHIKAREMIAQGELGQILTFKTTFGHGGPENWCMNTSPKNWFFDKQKAGLGVIADLGIHKTDLIQYLLQDTIVETTAKIATLDKKEASGEMISVDDNAICIYKMKSGVFGTMTASWTYYGAEDNSTIIYGTKGILKIYDDPDYCLRLITRDGGEVLYHLDQIQTNAKQTKTGVIDAFIDAIKNGTESIASGKSVLNAMKAVFAGIKSNELGTSVKIH